MNRRLFVRMGTWASLAISFFPTAMLPHGQNARKQSLLIELPKAKRHVRHGFFSTNQPDISKIRVDWLSNYQKDIFFRDGFSKGHDDLIHVSLRIQDFQLNMGLRQYDVMLTENSDSTQFELASNQTVNIFEHNGYSGNIIRLNTCVHHYSPEQTEEALFIPIRGSFNVDGQSINEDVGILSNYKAKYQLESNDESIVLIIHKHQ